MTSKDLAAFLMLWPAASLALTKRLLHDVAAKLIGTNAAGLEHLLGLQVLRMLMFGSKSRLGTGLALLLGHSWAA